MQTAWSCRRARPSSHPARCRNPVPRRRAPRIVATCLTRRVSRFAILAGHHLARLWSGEKI